MSALSRARGLLRKINDSDHLGETITCYPLTSGNYERGVRFGAAFTVVGLITYTEGAIEFADDLEQTRTAIMRTADTETRLSIGDRVEHDGQTWEVRSDEHPQGQFKYDLRSRTKLAEGPEDRGRG